MEKICRQQITIKLNSPEPDTTASIVADTGADVIQPNPTTFEITCGAQLNERGLIVGGQCVVLYLREHGIRGVPDCSRSAGPNPPVASQAPASA